MSAIDFTSLNEHALQHFDDLMDLLGLEGGKHVGKEYQALNPLRNDCELGSFSVNTGTGAWSDFALDDARGGDLISLVAYVEKIGSQAEAAAIVEQFLAGRKASNDAVADEPKASEATPPAATKAQDILIRLVPDDAPQATLGKFGPVSASWDYRNDEGRLMFKVLRRDKSEGGKEFLPLTLWRSPEGEMRWKTKGYPAPRPLYHLDELHRRPKAPVLVVEGEKAADAASQLFPEHVVVTTANGAQSPEKSDLTPLASRTVFIWPDHDDAGRSYANTIAEILRQLDGRMPISIMEPICVTAGYGADGQPTIEPGFLPPQGWDAADALIEGWTAAHIDLLPANYFVPVPVDTSYVTPDGAYLVSDDGVFALKINTEGKNYKVHVCSRIDVLAETCDRNNASWGLLLSVVDPDGNEHEWAMPSSMTAYPVELRATLLDLGAKLHSSKPNDLLDYLNSAKPKDRALCVSHPGWYDEVFVLGTKPYGQKYERVVVQTSDPTYLDSFVTRGTLENWKEQVAAPCQGNSRLMFALCAALVGPTLRLIGDENGGFHFFGGSSIGKTTALRVAASVWGGPSFLQTWRNTDNALESIAQRHNDTLLALDEMSQAEPEVVGQVAYMLGNGQGKGRANRLGVARSIATWRLVYLSTGEIKLADHLTSARGRVMAGQEVRLVNIPADTGSGLGIFEDIHGATSAQAFAEQFKINAAEYYGCAGACMIELLTNKDGNEDFAKSIRRGMAWFAENNVPVNASSQVLRVANRFGLVAAVGELAIRRGVLPFSTGEATEAVRICLNAWIQDRGGLDNLEIDQAIAQVRRFLELHGESRFTLWNDITLNNGDGRTINRAGFRRVTDDDRTEFIVLPEVWRTEICSGLNPAHVTKVLLEGGYLQRASDGKSTHSMRLPGMGKSQRVYCLSPDIMGSAG